MKPFLNYLLKLPWSLDGSVRNAFPCSFHGTPSLFYYSILIRCMLFNSNPEVQGERLTLSFYGQLEDYKSQALSTL